MKRFDEKTGKVRIEATSSDDYIQADYATFVLTGEMKQLVLDLQKLAEENRGLVNCLSSHRVCDVEFYEYDDSPEPWRIEGLTLHVDNLEFWFNA